MARPMPGEVDPDLYRAVDELLEPDRVPQLVAHGAEHLVLRLRKPGMVVKVNYAESEPVYEALLHGGADDLDDAMRRLRARRDAYLAKMATLARYFGRDAVPRQRVVITEVPVSAAVIDALRRRRDGSEREPGGPPEPAGPRSMPAWVAYQREVALDPGRTVSLGGYYLEETVLNSQEPGDLDDYAAVHDALVDPAIRPDAELRRKAIRLFDDLERVTAKLRADPDFPDALAQAVRGMIRYSQEVGEVLDVAGLDNIVMAKGQDGWRIKFLDALSSFDCTFDDLRRAARKLERGQELDGEEEVRAHYAMNTLRVINALAMLAGIPERLDIPEVRRVPAGRWLEALSEAAR